MLRILTVGHCSLFVRRWSSWIWWMCSLRGSDWAGFSCIISLFGWNWLNACLVLESSKHISSFDFLLFSSGIHMDKFIDMHKSSANSNQNLIAFFYFDVHPLLTEFVYPFTLPEEHNFQLRGFWSIVDILSKYLISLTFFVCNISAHSFHKWFNLLQQIPVFSICLFEFVFAQFKLIEQV